MTRFLLNVDRTSPAWTTFKASNANELPPLVRARLKELQFEIGSIWDGTQDAMCLHQHHHCHNKQQWDTAVQLLSIGYDFLNHEERKLCERGESSMMQMKCETSIVEYQRESHGSNLTIKVYNMK